MISLLSRTLVLLTVVLLACTLPALATAPETSLCASRIQSIVDAVVDQQGDDGLWDGDLQATSDAVAILTAAGQSVPNSKAVSKFVAAALAAFVQDDGYRQYFYAARAAAQLGVNQGQKVSAESQAWLQAGLDGEVLEDMYFAGQSVLAAVSNGQGLVDDYDWNKVLSTLLELSEDDGTVRHALGSEKSSLYNTGLALDLAGTVFSSVSILEDDSRQQMRSLSSVVPDALATAGEQLDFAAIPQGVTSIQAVAAFVQGLMSLGQALSEDLDVSSDDFGALASFLLEGGYSSQVSELAAVLPAVYAVAASEAVTVPVVKYVNRAAAFFQVQVTDVLGNPLRGASVTLTELASDPTWSSNGESQVVARNVELVGSEGAFTFPSSIAQQVSGGQVTPGFYGVSLRVSAGNGQTTESFGDIVVHGAYTPSTADVIVTTNAKLTGEEQPLTASFPQHVKLPVASARSFIHVTLTGSGSVSPTQVFVQLLGANQHSAVFVAAQQSAGRYSTRIQINSVDVEDALQGPGKYQLNLLIGDPRLHDAIAWTVGDIHVEVGVSDAGLTAVDLLKPGLEIVHQFNQPDERPSAVIAYGFSVLVMVVFVLFVQQLVSVGALSDLSTQEAPVFTLLLIASLVGFVLVYLAYFAGLYIYQAGIGVLVVGCVAWFAGNRVVLGATKQQIKDKEE